MSHASRASGRKFRRQQRKLASLAATLPNPPQRFFAASRPNGRGHSSTRKMSK